MTETLPEKFNYLTPEMKNVLTTIKLIQQQMSLPENINLSYAQLYHKMDMAFPEFGEKYASIFTNVIKGTKLDVIAGTMYFNSLVEHGEMTEEDFGKILAKVYLPK